MQIKDQYLSKERYEDAYYIVKKVNVKKVITYFCYGFFSWKAKRAVSVPWKAILGGGIIVCKRILEISYINDSLIISWIKIK